MDKYKNKNKYYKKRERKYSNNEKNSYKNKNSMNYKESNYTNEPNKFQKYYYNGENNENDYSYYDFESQKLKNNQNSQQMLNPQILNNQLPNPLTNNQITNNQMDNNQMGNNQLPNNQIPNNQLPNNQIPINQIHNNQKPNNQIPNNQMGNNYNRQVRNNLMSNMVNHQIGNHHMNNNQMINHQMGNHQMGNNQINNQRLPNYQMNYNQQISHQLNNHQLNNYQMNNQNNNSMISNNQISNNQVNNSQMGNYQMNNSQMGNHQINNRHINNLINSNNVNNNNLNMNIRQINNIVDTNNEINNNQNNFQINNQIRYKSENNMNNSINYHNNVSINSKNKIDSRNNINDIKESSQLVTDKKEYTPKNNNYNLNISKNNFDITTNYNDNNSNISNNNKNSSISNNNNNKNLNISINNKNLNISNNNNKNSNISYDNKNSNISYNNNNNNKKNSNFSSKNNPDNKFELKEELRKTIRVDNNNKRESTYINFAILSKYVDNINRIYFTKMRFKNYPEFIEDESEIKETIYEGIYKCKKDKISEGFIISDKLGELQIEKSDLNRTLDGSKVRFIVYKFKKSIIRNYNKDKNKNISLKIEEESDLNQENNEDLVEAKIENENLDNIDTHNNSDTNKDNFDDKIEQCNELENNNICELNEEYKDSHLEENSKNISVNTKINNISENTKINNTSENIETNSNSNSNLKPNITLFNNDSISNLNNKDDEILIYKPKIINVIDYNLDKVVASVKFKKNRKYLIINYLKKFPEFQISNLNFLKDIKDVEKKYFICEFNNWPTSSNLPFLQINNELGYYNDFNNELESIITNYKLPIQIYNKDINLSIKEKFSYLFHDENNFRFKKDNFSNNRVNLINKYVFSIDPKNATDLDDAISIETLENQNYLIGIHISDVNHFIKKGDEVDNIAKKMTTSFYFPLKKYDMLPKEFSSNLCSLNELNDKFAISIFLEFDKDSLKIINTELKKTIINVVKNLTYKEAEEIYKNHKNEDYKEKLINIEKQNKLLNYNKYYDDDNLKIIEKTDEKLIKSLVNIFELGNKLKYKRENNSIFNFKSKSELFFEFDKFNTPSSYEKIQRLESMDLIEELMIRANHEVAKILIKHNPENTILRKQEIPNNQNKLKYVNSILTHYKLFDMSDFDITKPNDYNKLIYLISIDNDFNQVEKEFLLEKLKSIFNSASYINSSENDVKLWKHSNMNFDCYTHFTSPIRRYVDILVHREIYAILDNNLDDYNNYYDKNKMNTMLTDINKYKSLCGITEALSNNLCLFSIKNYKFNTFALIMDNPGKEYARIFIQDIKYELKLYFKNLILQKNEIINEEKVFFYEYKNIKTTYFIQLKKYDIIPININFNWGSGKKEFFEVNFDINLYIKSNT